MLLGHLEAEAPWWQARRLDGSRDDSLEVAVQPWGYDGLDVLTSGPVPPNPGQLLNSAAMSALIQAAEQRYDTIVIDSAPLLRVVDAVWLGHLADGVLVVTRRRKTSPGDRRAFLLNPVAGRTTQEPRP